MLERIEGHTIDTSLLTNGLVIDLGCRDFRFAQEMSKRGCDVISVDADPSVFVTKPSNIKCVNKAISINKNKTIMIYNKLGEGGYTSEVKKYKTSQGVLIDTITLTELIPGDNDYDVLKIDIEGTEYLLLSDPNFKPLPKQISVEFHEHSLKEIHDKKIDSVMNNLNRWYNLIYTMKDNYSNGILYEYIDTLFVRR